MLKKLSMAIETVDEKNTTEFQEKELYKKFFGGIFMKKFFENAMFGNLILKNRLIRSAT